GRRYLLPEIPPVEGPAGPERRVCREDLQAAPCHEEEERHVQPVCQTDEPGLGTLALPPLIAVGCFHESLLIRANMFCVASLRCDTVHRQRIQLQERCARATEARIRSSSLPLVVRVTTPPSIIGAVPPSSATWPRGKR